MPTRSTFLSTGAIWDIGQSGAAFSIMPSISFCFFTTPSASFFANPPSSRPGPNSFRSRSKMALMFLRPSLKSHSKRDCMAMDRERCLLAIVAVNFFFFFFPLFFRKFFKHVHCLFSFIKPAVFANGMRQCFHAALGALYQRGRGKRVVRPAIFSVRGRMAHSDSHGNKYNSCRQVLQWK